MRAYFCTIAMEILIKCILILGICVSKSVFVKSSEQTELQSLTFNFFSNLQKNLGLQDETFNNTTTQFIDQQIFNYKLLIKHKYGIRDNLKTRRSILDEYKKPPTKGSYIFKGLEKRFVLEHRYLKDVVLFSSIYGNSEVLYAVVLQENRNNATNFIIYKLNNESFLEVFRMTSLQNDAKLGVYSLKNTAYLVLTETNAEKATFGNESGIFEFKQDVLTKIQNLININASDVTLWNSNGQLFMAMPQYYTSAEEGKLHYELSMPIYKWLGKHFEITDHIKTLGEAKITPFTIESTQFLAVANSHNNFGNTEVYSEVFKYDVHLDKFESYQKLLTNAASDVQYFELTKNNSKESFLVFANHFENGLDTKPNYETDSIVYKYVDRYFIPFQNFRLKRAIQCLPLLSQNGEVLLLALSLDGVKAYQYDGWKFAESLVELQLEDGITKMRSFQFKDRTLTVLLNENSAEIYEPTFEDKDVLGEYEEGMLDWCEQTLMELTPSKNRTKRDTLEQEVGELEQAVSFLRQELQSIEEQVQATLHHVALVNEFQDDLLVDKLILNGGKQKFGRVTSDTLNEFIIYSILSNVMDTTEGFQTDLLTFSTAQVNNDFAPGFINGYSTEVLQNFDDLIVSGTVNFTKDFTMDGTLNGIPFARDKLLLKTSNQTLPNFQATNFTVNRLAANRINGLEASSMESSTPRPKEFTSVIVNSLTLKGLLNSINITDLNQTALRISGNQTLEAPFKFDVLHVDNLVVGNFSGQEIPATLISIDGGFYEIPNHVRFAQLFSTNRLIVNEHMNGIQVVDGKPKLLLTNSEEVQHIEDPKIFENVHFVNPYKARGAFNIPEKEKYKAMKVITENNIVLRGDYFIHGNATVTEQLTASNLEANQTNFSVRRLKEHGMKLNTISIPLHLNFLHSLTVQEVFADTINHVDTRALIVMGLNETQVISGWKKFLQDVEITGPSELFYVNGINMQEFDSNILMVHGDQTMFGRHHFEHIVANRVFNVKTKLKENSWENVVTRFGHQLIEGTTILTNATSNQLTTNVLLAESLVNGLDFNAIMNDTAFRHKPLPAATFGDLVVENLVIKNYNSDFNMSADNFDFQFDQDVVFPESINVANLTVLKDFNGIPAEQFGHNLQDLDKQTMPINHTFDKLIVRGNISIQSNLINSFDFNVLKNHSVKLDEPFGFKGATFSHGLNVLDGVSLNGLFESLDLNDVVQSQSAEEQVFRDPVVFEDDVVVAGHTRFEGLISGYNVSKLCSEKMKNLQVNGNVVFSKGPKARYVNRRLVKSILDNAWFVNQDASINGSMKFNDVTFTEDITVDGFLDNIKTQLIYQTYLSKSRNQTISAALEFDEYVIFSKGVNAKEGFVTGEMGGINLNQFMRTVILDGFDQIFETPVQIDICEIHDLRGDYLVNNFNLERDVMRYDKYNMVTGKKVVKDLQIYKLLLEKPINVQNVDILWWLQASVLKSGTFQIPGNVTFTNETVFRNDLNTQCPLNEVRFTHENVVTKSTPQAITGKKTFVQTVAFDSATLTGLLNGVNMSELMLHQAHQDTDLLFNSPIELQGELLANNVNVEKLYQGVNVSQLISNITRLDVAENYYEKYEKLFNISQSILKALEGQAYYLDHYEVQRKFMLFDDVLPIKSAEVDYLALVKKEHGGYVLAFQILDDDDSQEIAPVNFQNDLVYMENLAYEGKNCWYAEHKLQNGAYQGGIYTMSNNGLLNLVPPFFHNGSKAIASIVIPNEAHESLVALSPRQAVLYRKNELNSLMEPLLIIPASYGKKILTKAVQGLPYILILNEGTPSESPSVTIWKYLAPERRFQQVQIIPVSFARDLASISYHGSTYLALSSYYLSDPDCAGSELIDLRKFNPKKGQFETIQKLTVDKPVKIEFSKLPTNELILYVITDNPKAPLGVYLYEGVAGFKRKHVALALDDVKMKSIHCFNTEQNDHYVLIQTRSNQTLLVEAIFEGQKFT